MKFHHIGIATNDIEKSLNFLKNQFKIVSISKKIFDEKQNAYLMLVKTEDMTYELVSGEMVKNLIKKNITYYHICYEVKNLEKAIKQIDGILVSPPKEAILFNNRKVAFLITPLGLIELLEEKK